MASAFELPKKALGEGVNGSRPAPTDVLAAVVVLAHVVGEVRRATMSRSQVGSELGNLSVGNLIPSGTGNTRAMPGMAARDTRRGAYMTRRFA